MAKFSKEEKLVAVKRYIAGEGSLRGIPDSICADPDNFPAWLKQFEYRGEEAFEKSYTTYSASDKLGTQIYARKQDVYERDSYDVYGKLFIKMEVLTPYNQRKRGINP
ncbi:hypothetical protein [Jeotgalibacillus marinus]|uniref:Transposase n=1 Tax=Jeotgalibacillus marinus TaxID=86667 RepID=A0ABV3PZA0_9BACL